MASLSPTVSCSNLVTFHLTPATAPAQHVIKYELRTFAKLGALSKYHGPPTDETDEAWNSLYPVGMSRISKEEASRIANWTERIPGDDHYVVQLDAWHQIHCLNLIRKALLPERYGPSRLFDSVLENDDTPFDHVDHCVNILRENIVCNADTTPNVFQWNEDKQMMFPHFDSVHMCRDWDAVKEWTHERQLLAPFQDKVRPSRLDD
ncbi:hypothetical protein SISSUDRAFT_1106600 [Sistotremastrum suecicum HHB10207 ss-3]|uniref:Uncharacterized protein n=1 Tax=Sistotremastrum suecicum HHB10207 ss-3 TaxID=1314776 RepID=A0A166CJI4_9AGAM|nr:hypothetical protein SISSUDRAFT_1106600 [Sistotremastrum suecicum HHB10207 ss-3]